MKVKYKSPYLYFLSLLLTVSLTSANRISAEEAENYTFKTLFVYQFSKYIQWPKQSDRTVIGILDGNKDIIASFKKMAVKKSVSGSSIEVQNYSSVAAMENCHILFVPKKNSNMLKAILAKYGNSPVLIVTESDGLAKKGSCINFRIMNGKLKFEMNLGNMKKAGLKVPQQLTNLAILV